MPLLHSAKLPRPKSEDEFEDLCLEALQIKWGVPTQRNGRRGQRQHGVDIFATQNGATLGAQCKNVDTLAFKMVLEVVIEAAAFRPGLTTLVFVVGAERDEELQESVSMHFSESPAPFVVELMFWPDIVRQVTSDRAVIRKFWPEFFEDIERAEPLTTPAFWRRELSPEDLRQSTAWGNLEEEVTAAWRAKRGVDDEGTSAGMLSLPDEFPPAGDEARFVEDQGERWRRALGRAGVTKTDPDLEICLLRETDEGELDIGVRNVSDRDLLITGIEIIVLKDFGWVAPMLEPTARYAVRVDDLGVGDARRINVVQLVAARSVDRFLVALDDLRTLLLHVVLHTKNGRGASGDVWLFPQGFDENDESTATE